MTKWAEGPTPPTDYLSPYPNDRRQNTLDQDEAANGRSRTLTYYSAKQNTDVETTAWVKNDGGARRHYLSLAWREDGKRREFRVCAADQGSRPRNLRRAWDLIHEHHLLTQRGRDVYRLENPGGHGSTSDDG